MYQILSQSVRLCRLHIKKHFGVFSLSQCSDACMRCPHLLSCKLEPIGTHTTKSLTHGQWLCRVSNTPGNSGNPGNLLEYFFRPGNSGNLLGISKVFWKFSG